MHRRPAGRGRRRRAGAGRPGPARRPHRRRLSRGRRVAPHGRVRAPAERSRPRAALGQLHQLGFGGLPRHQGWLGLLRQRAGVRGPAVQGGQLRVAGRHQPHPADRAVADHPHRRRADHQPGSRPHRPGRRHPQLCRRRRRHDPRGSGPADQRHLRHRRGPAGPPPGSGAGVAGGRGPGARRRPVRRQDRHADDGRHRR